LQDREGHIDCGHESGEKEVVEEISHIAEAGADQQETQNLRHEAGFNHKQAEWQKSERPEQCSHLFPMLKQVKKEHGHSLELDWRES